MFIIVGAAGVVLAAVWWSIHRDPREVSLTDGEIRYLTRRATRMSQRVRHRSREWKRQAVRAQNHVRE